MLRELFMFYLLHPLRIKELLAVKKFRSIREEWDNIDEARKREALLQSKESQNIPDDLESLQYVYTAALLKMAFSEVKRAVETWIYEKPLSFLRSCRDEEAARLFEVLREKGIGIYIFSDYPVTDKLKALGFASDGCYAATDERLGVLKPDPKGLELIMEDFSYKPSEILMIGDRDSRDGEAARRAGCDYVILSKSRKKRNGQYKELYL